MKITEAMKLIANYKANLSSIRVDLSNALNQVLAQDILAIDDAPRFSNSAMDGYALNNLDADKWLCKGTVFAGDFNHYQLGENECVKIMTGAKLPEGTQAVLMVENSKEEGGYIINTGTKLKPFDAMRMQAEEYKKGTVLIKTGKVLDSASIMLAAANGYYELEVIKQPKVGIFASGDELLEPYERGLGVYNSNAYGILAICSRYFDAKYFGILKDNKAQVQRALLGACEHCDLLISIGAASMGDADYIKSALLEAGFHEVFNKLNLKPGGPVGFFNKGEKFILTLPGNPMSSFTCMQLFMPALRQLFGAKLQSCSQRVKLAHKVIIRNHKENIIYGRVENSQFVPFNHGKFSSGQITPITSSTHYVRLFEDNEALDEIEVFELL